MVTSVQQLKNHKNEVSLLSGKSISINNFCQIHCPTINEIEEIGESDFFSVFHLLITDQSSVDEFCKKHTNLPHYVAVDFIYILLQSDPYNYLIASNILQCFFQTEVLIDCKEKALYINYAEQEPFVIMRDNFFQLQNILRIIMGQEVIEDDEDLSQITDPHVLKIKQKLRESNAIRKEQQTNGNYTITLSDMICSISIYSGLPLETLFNYNYFTICKLYDRVRNKQSYEEKFKMLTAGADIKDISDWMMTQINK